VELAAGLAADPHGSGQPAGLAITPALLPVGVGGVGWHGSSAVVMVAGIGSRPAKGDQAR
jgi:hypothetical protein